MVEKNGPSLPNCQKNTKLLSKVFSSENYTGIEYSWRTTSSRHMFGCASARYPGAVLTTLKMNNVCSFWLREIDVPKLKVMLS